MPGIIFINFYIVSLVRIVAVLKHIFLTDKLLQCIVRVVAMVVSNAVLVLLYNLKD